MSRLKGQTAVITGASSGIGAAIARKLSEAGMSLVLTARREDMLNDLAAGLPGESAVLAADIAAQDTPERLLKLAQERFGRVDAVINNAGILRVGSFNKVDVESLLDMSRVNFDAVVRSSYVFGRAFKAQGSGAIVNVSSIGAYMLSTHMAVYIALKHALEAFTQSLRIELSPTGVKVGTVAPGTTRTEIFENANSKTPIDRIPLESEDVAEAVRFMLDQPARSNVARLAIFSQGDNS